MLGASLLPARFRGADSQNVPSRPSCLNKKLSPLLQSLSRRSCTHPIHTIVFVALLASTSYIGLLEGSLFESGSPSANSARGVDLASLLDGGRHLKVGKETGWKWQPESRDVADFDNVSSVPQNVVRLLMAPQTAEHLALLTLVFPNSLSTHSSQTAPLADQVRLPSNSTVEALPSTSNPFSPISQDTTLAFSVRWDEAPVFLDSLQEIPEQMDISQDREGRLWVMKANKNQGNTSQNALRNWATNAWTEFVDLLKV